MTQVKERPILFSGSMVRAILEGRKTQTRRVVKEKHLPFIENILGVFLDGKWNQRPMPYGQPGDRLWVRETWQHAPQQYCYCPQPSEPSPCDDWCEGRGCAFKRGAVVYRADESKATSWRSPIHMPRWASRITLEITAVRVERLNDISEQDAKAEGAYGGHASISGYGYAATPLEHFRYIWESINGAGSWEKNPWVWVIEFRRIEG